MAKLLFLFAAAFVSGAAAQQITGTITGTVTDPQGAVVPKAEVRAINKATGLSRTVATDSSGIFAVTYLPAGEYSVAVDAPGFKHFLQQNVTLSVDQNLTLNVSLTIGEATDTVEVTDLPPSIETQSAELGRTISPEEIIGLPLVNRNAYAEISLTPGVMANSTSPQSNPNGTPNFVIGVARYRCK